MKVIMLCGKAGAGKDVTASMIQDVLSSKGYTSVIFPLAAPLKFVLKNIYGWDGNKDDKGRELLQQVGTEVFHNAVSPSVWSDFVLNIIDALNADNSPIHYDYFIIPDCRFLLEYKNFKTAKDTVSDLKLIKVYSKFGSNLTDEQKHHSSEAGIPAEYCDYFFDNNKPKGSEEFRQDVKDMLQYLYSI